MVAVITSTAPGNLGFNPLRAVARVVTNPNVQRVATAAAGSYAPAQYAQAQQYVSRARKILTPPPGAQVAPPSADDAPDMPAPHPKSGSGMLTLAAIGGGLLLVLLLTRR